MAKVKLKKTEGLESWLPDTKMKDSVDYIYCPNHGLQEDGFWGYVCLHFQCKESKLLGKIKEWSALERLIYGVEDVKVK